MVAGKAAPLANFRGDMKNLERWILQIDDYFTITQICKEQQQFTYIALYTEGEALEWWKVNSHKYNM